MQKLSHLIGLPIQRRKWVLLDVIGRGNGGARRVIAEMAMSVTLMRRRFGEKIDDDDAGDDQANA